MARLLPPPPIKENLPTPFRDWLNKLYMFLGDTSNLILWNQIDTSGSELDDITTRPHSMLQGIAGSSEGFHLSGTQHTDLTDGGDSSLHFHSSDRARANHTGTQESSTVLVERVGTPTYTSLQDFVNLSQSAGRISGGTLSDAGSANLNVAAGTGWLRIADDDVSTLKFFNWSSSNSNAIPAGTTRYIGVEYNAGSPQVVIKTTDTWNEDTEFQLGEVSNESGTLHIINNPFWVSDAITNIIQRFSAFQHVARDNTFGGLIIGETGTRNVTITAGHIWSRLNDFHFNAFNSSTGGTFDRYYRNGSGGFTREAAQTQWPNTQYDDGSGTLVTMTNNRYANIWFYAETDGDVVMLYGQNQYTSAANAEVESPPATIPTRLQSTGLLIGRIIFQKSAAMATTISSAFATVFNPVAASDHNLLAGLQGGTTGEYFHLTSAEYTGTGTGGFVRKSGGDLDPASIGATTRGTVACTTLNASGNTVLGDATTDTVQCSGVVSVGNATPAASGAGITFPATQSASADPNTLDDYEEGTWTPSQGAGLTLVGAFSSTGTYTKIGRLVTVEGSVSGATSVAVAATSILCGNLPFSAASASPNAAAINAAGSVSTVLFTSTTSLFAVNAIAATPTIFFAATYRV